MVNTKVEQISKCSAFRADLTEGLNLIFKEALAMRCPRRKLKTLVSGGTEGTGTSKVHMYQ